MCRSGDSEMCYNNRSQKNLRALPLRTIRRTLQWCQNSVQNTQIRYVNSCDKCQRTGNISKYDEMPQTYMLSYEIFDIWELIFWAHSLVHSGINIS
ncbi:reverse transcriptase [Gossypium australe]|uniref:Reverse transcriptase n=1 Tax=Gossypium australe TaxID=47621 RepID=A0A5B6V6T8_9ROSI|nr:reverse transcriptase [Gossypium australe]